MSSPTWGRTWSTRSRVVISGWATKIFPTPVSPSGVDRADTLGVPWIEIGLSSTNRGSNTMSSSSSQPNPTGPTRSGSASKSSSTNSAGNSNRSSSTPVS